MDENKLEQPHSGGENRQLLIGVMVGVVLLGACALFFLGFLWLQANRVSSLAELFPSPTATRRPASTPAPTRTLAPNLTATRGAWVKPKQSPSLASAEQVQSALDSGTSYLEAFSSVSPGMPDINQPGDVYLYDIELTQSQPLIWSYGWCTTTLEILNDNFAHIQIEFTLNESPVPSENIAVIESSREDGSPCREFVALIETWTPGEHHLETRVAFTQDIHDGWDLYPAGTHTFKYVVTLQP